MNPRLQGVATTAIVAAVVIIIFVGIAVWGLLFFGPAH